MATTNDTRLQHVICCETSRLRHAAEIIFPDAYVHTLFFVGSNTQQQAFRPDEDVDINAMGGGYNVGYITAGEYLRYTVDVTQDGTRHDQNVYD